MEICNLDQLMAFRQESLDDDATRSVLENLNTSEVHCAAFHRELAEWAEELEDASLALREWSLAVRDDPKDHQLMRRLIDVYLDAGKPEKAARHLRDLVAEIPEDPDLWAELVEALSDGNQHDAAEDARQRASALTGDKRFSAPLPKRDSARSHDQDFELLDEAFLVVFQSLFQGREGVYARQWVDPEGQTGYTPIRQPATLKVYRNHLLGNHTLGIYPLRMDNTVFFVALDLDLAATVVKNCAPGSRGWNEAMQALDVFAAEILEFADSLGLKLHLADSGQKGRHLWAFFAEPIPARLARRMGKLLLSTVTPPPVLSCEIFPKQNSVEADGLGNLIKIPLGVHQKTQRRVWFTAAEGDLASQKEYLSSAARITREQLIHCLESRPTSAIEQFLELAKAPTLAQETETEGNSALNYHLDDDSELQSLMGHCVTLRTLVDKVDQTGEMTHDEARVVIHTIGHLVTGPAAVNTILGRALEPESSLYLKSPLRGNPMSCAKIRNRIPSLTSTIPCDCYFPQEAGLYPTPLLHLRSTAQGPCLEKLQFQALLQDYLRTKRELERCLGLLQNYQHRLSVWFDEAGTDELQTSFGLLRRCRSTEADGDEHFELAF